MSCDALYSSTCCRWSSVINGIYRCGLSDLYPIKCENKIARKCWCDSEAVQWRWRRKEGGRRGGEWAREEYVCEKFFSFFPLEEGTLCVNMLFYLIFLFFLFLFFIFYFLFFFFFWGGGGGGGEGPKRYF